MIELPLNCSTEGDPPFRITCELAEQRPAAEELQEWLCDRREFIGGKLGLAGDPQIKRYGSASLLHLHLDQLGLQLVLQRDPAKRGGLRVEWLGAEMAYRRKTLGKRQPLARAVAVRPGLKVLDVTFGFGKDAFFLATMGCQVRGIERSPIVYVLAADGLRRWREASAESEHWACPIQLEWGDALKILNSLDEESLPNIIYLDPMYPSTKKTALPKKELQWLRTFVGTTPEEDKALFKAAMRIAKERVVVKRPLGARPLAEGVWKNYSGQTTRYDVYLPDGP